MFDIGFWEMAFISVIALLVIGPERLPGVARAIGIWVGKARRMINDVKRDFKQELDEAELNNLKELKDDINSAAKELKRTADEAIVETEKSGSGLKETIESVGNESFEEITKTPPAPATTENSNQQKTANPAKKNSNLSSAIEKPEELGSAGESQDDLPGKATA
ncbi:MAG: Sec-independent protein translocase protein TatB [Gammaproteobacteria bacterium]|nr:Sec-independent protein translocase protein TatB [Gammaproteobacteria bacterium]MCY4219148.1 Sec-independent protein translocase protein TatB [Gammaproteobacteria bacterium]MCY4274568.1 Sec-independent protein translocase protein TatB [Gammaproteobacteria bacterium]